jgi:cytochrome oxidase Cu insertion factor (SCO1/SenC/PrrC family)
MVTRLLAHPLFAPALVLTIFGLGAGTVALLLLGPELAGGSARWIDTLLTVCFGWDAEARRYRLDALLLVLLQPPLFALVVFLFYREDCLAFLRSGRRSRVLAAGVALAFASLAASLLATSEISASGGGPTAATLPPPLRQGEAAPAFRLLDHRSRPIALDDLRGRPVVMTFVYADCHASCPILIERLRALEARDPAAQVAFVAVSLDPEHETPATLAAAAARWGLGPRWHLVTGEPAAVRALLRAHRVQWAPLPNGQIAHENVITLIDRRGRLAFTYRGLAWSEARQAAELGRLLAEKG